MKNFVHTAEVCKPELLTASMAFAENGLYDTETYSEGKGLPFFSADQRRAASKLPPGEASRSYTRLVHSIETSAKWHDKLIQTISTKLASVDQTRFPDAPEGASSKEVYNGARQLALFSLHFNAGKSARQYNDVARMALTMAEADDPDDWSKESRRREYLAAIAPGIERVEQAVDRQGQPLPNRFALAAAIVIAAMPPEQRSGALRVLGPDDDNPRDVKRRVLVDALVQQRLSNGTPSAPAPK